MHWYKTGHREKDTKDSTASFVHNRNRENIKSGETHGTIFGKIARYFADLKLVAFTGSYNDLNGKPSSLPASDVSAWAKAASKPSYSWNEIGSKPSYSWDEIGSKPSTFPPATHTHSDYAAKSKYNESTVSVGRKAGTATGGLSFVFGNDTEASGWCSFAYGNICKASGRNSYATGEGAVSTGYTTYAEGWETKASNYYSRAEGAATEATGQCSHASGDSTA